MNLVVLFSLLLILGLSQAQFRSSEEDSDLTIQLQAEENLQNVQGSRKVLRRVARNAFSGLAQKYIPAMEKIIIDNCKANGQNESAEKLQSIFDEMKTCVGKKKLYITPREEFLANLEECSKISVKQSKNCLAETQHYFPDLLLSLAKSVSEFLYDDYDIIRVDLVACFPKLNNVKVITNYQQCLSEVAVRYNDSRHIADTKAEFCQTFVPTAYCFTNMIKENCDRTSGLVKFRGDYLKLHQDVCEEDTV